jgi:phosphopantetheinyl transferase
MTIRIAWLNVRNAAPLIARWATAEDHAHAARRKPEPARDSVAARALARRLAALVTGQEDWRIVPDPERKPHLCAPDGAPPPAISLAHSGGIAVAAIGPAGIALGVDVEPHKPRDFAALAARVYGKLEQEQVAAEGVAAFYRVWTGREARAKAIGTGMTAVMEQGDQIGPGLADGRWQWGKFHFLHSLRIQGHSLTLACDGAFDAPLFHDDGDRL